VVLSEIQYLALFFDAKNNNFQKNAPPRSLSGRRRRKFRPRQHMTPSRKKHEGKKGAESKGQDEGTPRLFVEKGTVHKWAGLITLSLRHFCASFHLL